jgi:hypothetical protein
MADKPSRDEMTQTINFLIRTCTVDKGELSDGYHTFNALYAHRNRLWILACRLMQDFSYSNIWRSKKNADGSIWDGWFLLGTYGNNQCTYHLPMDLYEETSFAQTLEVAPPFDGHTSEDVLKRLSTL